MKFFFIIFCSLSLNICNGQTKRLPIEDQKIKNTAITFLKWYKQKLQTGTAYNIIDSTKNHHSIVVEENIDTLVKLSIDMKAVEGYLINIKSSKCVSESFINDLRQYHQKIADEVKTYSPYPKKEGRFSIPGLNLDPIFGFEPEEILNHINEGRFTNICSIYDKAIVKFDISKFSQYIFTMSKIDGKWLIDYFGIDRTNYDNQNKRSRQRK